MTDHNHVLVDVLEALEEVRNRDTHVFGLSTYDKCKEAHTRLKAFIEAVHEDLSGCLKIDDGDRTIFCQNVIDNAAQMLADGVRGR